jgi:lambda family phage portal protein
MNPIDRVVNFFSAEAGLRRIQARAKAALLMNYDAASRGDRTSTWKGPGSSADAAAFGARGRLRYVSRDMVRNRAYASRARDVVMVNVVGQGIVPSVKAATPEIAELVKAALAAHLLTPAIDSLGEYDLYEMQQIVMSGVFTDGEVLVRRRLRDVRLNPGLVLPYQVELLEVDYLDQTIQSWGKNPVVEGVEYGPTGAIEAYHLYNEHPGAVTLRKSLQSIRVHWSDVLHIRRFDRPGQLRGVPWLAPVMLTLGDLSDYQEAQILKQRMSALMAAVIEWEDDAKRPANATGMEELKPGAMVNLPFGAKVKFTEPPLVNDYDAFMRRGLAAVAVGIGITLESLSGDLKGVNFSSGRMGRMEMDRLVKAWQTHLMIGQFCKGMTRWFREGMSMVNAYRGLDFDLDWTPPRRMLVDPTKEIPAMIEEMDAGLTSRQRNQRELGYDPETIRRERVEDQTADKDAGLPPPTAPAKVAAKTRENEEGTEEVMTGVDDEAGN